MNFKEVFEKIKEHLTKEKLIGYWKWLWGKEPEPVDESVFEDPDRYIKVDEYDDSYWQDEKRYKREKRNLRIRRFFVSICVGVFVIVSLVTLRWTVVESVRHAIASNRFLMCMGKDVCIYEGPRVNYPEIERIALNLDNGDIFVINTRKINYLYYCLFGKLERMIKYYSGYYKNTRVNNSKYEEKDLYQIEYYDSKQKKFIKIKNNFINENYWKLATNSAGNVLLIPSRRVTYNLGASNIVIFDRNTKQLSKTNFKMWDKKILYEFISQYSQNKALIRKKYKNKYGDYYFLNLDNFTIEKLPEFVISQKQNYASGGWSYQYKTQTAGFHEYKLLKNGKILFLITDCNMIFYDKCKASKKLKYIEIYDPSKNKFFISKNIMALKNNVFEIEIDNGDILFINEDSSYILKNKTNTFVKVHIEEENRNNKTLRNLKYILNSNGIKTNFNDADLLNILKVAPKKFVITCGPWQTIEKVSNECKQTIYYDYEKNILSFGPRFIYNPVSGSAPVLNINNNEFIFLGGGEPFNDFILPNRYTQILYIKNKNERRK